MIEVIRVSRGAELKQTPALLFGVTTEFDFYLLNRGVDFHQVVSYMRENSIMKVMLSIFEATKEEGFVYTEQVRNFNTDNMFPTMEKK